MISIFIRHRRGHNRGEGKKMEMEMEAEAGVTWPQARNSWGCQKLEEPKAFGKSKVLITP